MAIELSRDEKNTVEILAAVNHLSEILGEPVIGKVRAIDVTTREVISELDLGTPKEIEENQELI